MLYFYFAVSVLITSGVISSVISYIFKLLADRNLIKVKEELSAKNKQLEIEFTALKGREKHDYELIISSLRNIWVNFSNIEDFLILGIKENFTWNTDYPYIRKEANKIRSEILLLPDDIYKPIDRFLMDLFEVHLTTFHTKSKQYCDNNLPSNIKFISDKEHPYIMTELNKYLLELQSKYWFGRDELRIEIRRVLKEYFKTL
jgi:hypothetical protein